MKKVIQFFNDGGLGLILYFGPFILLAIPVVLWNATMALIKRSGAAVARLAHNQKVASSILASATLLLAGCASTSIYENGQLVLKTQADATNITFDTHNGHFHADTLNHSMATLAGGQSAAQVIGASGTAAGVVAGAVITGGIVK